MRLPLVLLCVLATSAVAKPPSKTLERAIKLYDKQDFASAAIELEKVTSGQSGDDPANLERAQFFVGKTLYQLGYYLASYAAFTEITQTGASHRYFTAAVKWYAALAEKLPPAHVRALSVYTQKDLSDPINTSVREQVSYVRGLHALEDGKLDPAIRELKSVTAKSPYFSRAQLALGFTHLRKSRTTEALAAFASIPALDPAADLAALATGQLHMRSSQYDKAIEAYTLIPSSSPLATRAAWEASWAALAKQKKAPTKLVAVATTPVLSPDGPESPTLFAAVSYDFCMQRPGLDALAGFRADAAKLEKQLATILADDADDNAAFYADHAGPLRAGNAKTLAPRLQLFAHLALNGAVVSKRAAILVETERELATLAKADRAWQSTAIANDILTELTLTQALAQADVGAAARERLTQLAADLAQLKKLASTKFAVSRPGGVGLAVICP